MNELNSLFIATIALSIGGLGLYWYKNSDNNIFSNDDNEEDNYNDYDSEDDNDETSQEDDELYNKKREKKTVKKPTINTKRNIKKSSGTKRRY